MTAKINKSFITELQSRVIINQNLINQYAAAGYPEVTVINLPDDTKLTFEVCKNELEKFNKMSNTTAVDKDILFISTDQFLYTHSMSFMENFANINYFELLYVNNITKQNSEFLQKLINQQEKIYRHELNGMGIVLATFQLDYLHKLDNFNRLMTGIHSYLDSLLDLHEKKALTKTQMKQCIFLQSYLEILEKLINPGQHNQYFVRNAIPRFEEIEQILNEKKYPVRIAG